MPSRFTLCFILFLCRSKTRKIQLLNQQRPLPKHTHTHTPSYRSLTPTPPIHTHHLLTCLSLSLSLPPSLFISQSICRTPYFYYQRLKSESLKQKGVWNQLKKTEKNIIFYPSRLTIKNDDHLGDRLTDFLDMSLLWSSLTLNLNHKNQNEQLPMLRPLLLIVKNSENFAV